MNVTNHPIRFEFTSVHDEDFLLSLSNLVGAKPENGVLNIAHPFGAGSIVRKELHDDLTVICWDFQLNADVIFSKQIAPKSEDGRSLVINYLLEADNVVMESPSLKRKFNLRGNLNLFLLPDDIDLNFEVKAGVKVKVVSVSVKPTWLKKEYEGMEPGFKDFLHRFLHTDKPPVFMESSTLEEFRMLGELVKSSSAIPKGIPTLKPHIMTLIADFFYRIYNKPFTDVLESRIMHYQKMLQVEEILKSYMEKSLPDIDSIARMVTLSVSTLKRHFKLAYGKGVYDHYLELKMEYAKRLLMEKDLSVNEVATMMNYEKVSSFIDMFKKHQGCSPGILRRKAS